MKFSLREHMQQSAGMRMARFFSLCFDVCGWIEKQHREGRVLAKLCPDMIFVDSQTRQVELDESVHVVDEIDRYLPYIPPEQIGKANKEADYRSDFYSLGVVFYEFLTGELPFSARDVLEWSYVHKTVELKPLDDLNPEIPSVLSDIIMKLLNKSPDERYQSVVGLSADLQKCYTEFQTTGQVKPFVLGEMDLVGHLKSQSTFLERTAEISVITELYNRVSRGYMEVLLVSGAPGVGKTALVKEFNQKVIGSEGYFVYGHFNQDQNDTACFTVIQVIRTLVKQILIDKWQEQCNWENISCGTSDYERLLLQINLEMQRLLDKNCQVRQTEQTERDTSLNALEEQLVESFKSLLQIIPQSEYPIVIFLDDLQWIDVFSVKLLQVMTSVLSKEHVLLLGGYRTSETDQNHPLFSTKHCLKDEQIPVTYVRLNALDMDATCKLVMHVLKSEDEDIKAFAKGVFCKSAGNPSCIIEIIWELYEKGHLFFSLDEWRWKYDGRGLYNISIAESAIKSVLQRISELPAETVELLEFASCLGKELDLDILSVALNRNVRWIQETIQPALNLCVVVEKSSKYEFWHDLVVETFYSLMSDMEKKEAHFALGKAILQKSMQIKDKQDLFRAINHLDQGIDLIDNEEERMVLAECNLKVVREGKTFIEPAVLLKYLEVGLGLLPENSWESCYRLTFDLYMEYYRYKFMREDFQAAEPIFKLLVEKAKTPSDKVELYCQKTTLCVGYYTDEEAILSGLAALKYMGFKMPMNPSNMHLVKEFLIISSQLARREIESLLELEEMKDDRLKKIMSILASLVPPSSLVNSGLFKYILLKMVSISLKYGNCEESALAYASFGLVCSQLGRIREAVKFKDLSVALAEKYNCSTVMAEAYYTISVYLNHWISPLRESLTYAEKAHQYACESGYALFITAIQTEMVQMRYAMGESLHALYCQNIAALVENAFYEMPALLDILYTVNQFIMNLKGETFDSFTFSSIDYYEDSVANRMLQTNSGIIVPFYYLMKMHSCYLHGKPEETFRIAMDIQNKLELIDGKILYVEHVYWACLAVSAVYHKLANEEKKRAWKLFKKNMQLLKKWAGICKENFSHKYSLVSAEQYRLDRDVEKAMTAYQNAIKLAQARGYLFDAAVACELAARFYLDLGFEQNAQVHLVNACKLYRDYGAVQKVNFLKAEYPEMLAEIEYIPLRKQEELNVYDTNRQEEAAADDSVAENLTIMSKVSQRTDVLLLKEISETSLGDIDLNDLLKKLLVITVKSTGAQRACLMEVRNNRIITIAHKENRDEAVICFNMDTDVQLFSHSVVMSVISTGEPLILGNASCDLVFGRERYIRDAAVKSVLCLPIFTKDDLVGILYLENNLTTSAFSMKRVDILGKLTAHAIKVWKLASVFRENRTNDIEIKQVSSISFTERETKIIQLMIEGLSNLEIAERMHISEGTVKWHSNKIFKKLGVKNRTQAVLRISELQGNSKDF